MQIKLTRAEWEAEGTRRFGEDKRQWKFKCPICKYIASAQDWLDAGASEGSIGFSCIGRYRKGETQKFIDTDKKSSGKMKVGVPCDYAGGGLFKLNPIEIIEDGSTWFEFADKDEK